MDGETLIAEILDDMRITYVREYRFDITPNGTCNNLGLIQYLKKNNKIGRKVGIKPIKTPRLFRFDFAIPNMKIAIEFEGGTFTRGAHNRGDIYFSDCQKYNLAASQGWRILRFTTSYLSFPDIIKEDIQKLIDLVLEGEMKGGSSNKNGGRLFSS